MRVQLLCLTFVLTLVANAMANPLLVDGISSRTLFQQNMKCNTRSAFKRITMSGTSNYATNAQNCEYTVRAYSLKVCQIRIDFTQFNLEQPSSTTKRDYAHCAGDRLSISGMPDLCGSMNGQHIYVPFDVKRLSDDISIYFDIGPGTSAAWNIEVNQIECNHKAALVTPDVRQAPEGCLQYFYDLSGRVESFNYGQYFGDLHYAICFSRNNYANAMLELTEILFEMDGNADGFDRDCLDDDPDKPKDYIALPSAELSDGNPYSLFCLKSLDGETLTYRGAGPLVIHVNTDRITPTGNVEKGFRFKYQNEAPLNMKCNTKSALKHVTMSNSIIYDPNSQNCQYGIRAFSTKVCQLRVEIVFMELDQPKTTSSRQYAHCADGRLTIGDLQFALCGRMFNQHIYVPFDVQRLAEEVKIEFQISSNSFAMWNMEVHQIECNHKAALVTPDERQAPDGCLQYFYQNAGVVESFNFGMQYLGNTQYAICFNRNYNQTAVLELSEITFEMDGNGATPPLGYDSECLDPSVNSPNNKKDYIAIPFATVTDNSGGTPTSLRHSLFCLKSLNGNTLEYAAAGPIVIHVNTDEITDTAVDETGFRFKYVIRKQ
ncbi:hypothetical protein Bhyg_06687 [Pseudolycoriella hygida]|uniref:CUB domain-containing protein n=1 Tax=Pseudolycoriella hygida TaxID=35572 RepID=A0A9Q0N2D1_9DIPT|nr:hypothetical protein Bhyg_06687 [Pseudolycoriella hygida]